MPEVNACWCSATAREPLGAHYAECRGCGGLLYTGPFDVGDYLVADGETGFYGSRYWKQHVPDVLRLPGLEQRARADLADRSIHYLKGVLQYAAPGGSVLEIGSPGSLAYLLNLSGVHTTGIEMGDDIVGFVRRRFGVDVLAGPLEEVDAPPTFDAVVMIDVLEHLPLPLTTLRGCADCLTDSGVLILQTPCYRGESADWSMLIPDEHLFLYTERSVQQLLETAGFEVVEVRDALFSHDMWVVASRNQPAAPRPDPFEGVAPIGRAMIDLFDAVAAARDESDRLATDFRAAQRDAEQSGTTLAELSAQHEAMRADQREQATLIAATDEELKRLRADQADKEALIAKLSGELALVRADQADKDGLIRRMNDELAAVRADQSEKLALIERVSAELAEVRADQRAKEALIAELAAPSEGSPGRQ